jgi:hypothetical protein
LLKPGLPFGWRFLVMFLHKGLGKVPLVNLDGPGSYQVADDERPNDRDDES